MAAQAGLIDAGVLAHTAEDLLQKGMAARGLEETEAGILEECSDAINRMVAAFVEGIEPPATAALVARVVEAAGAGSSAAGAGASSRSAVSHPVANIPGGEHLDVTLKVAEGAGMPSVRVFMAVKRLGEAGEVRGVNPPEALGKTWNGAGTVVVSMAPGVRDEVVRSALGKISLLELVSIQRAGQPSLRKAIPVRVSPEILDRLQDQVGELLLVRQELETVAKRLERGLDEPLRLFKRILRELDETVNSARLVPLRLITAQLPLRVREMASKLGREAGLRISGDETGMDRSYVERLEAPLMHMLRNAVDHGIEGPAEREAAGKPVRGSITLDVMKTEHGVSITVTDDGRGIDAGKIKDEAVRRGLVTSERAGAIANVDLMELLCLPGFSTAKSVTELSGRGVGLDVVRRAVSEIGGQMAISSTPGRGTAITIDLPASMLRMRAMLVESGRERFAVPVSQVVAVLDLAPGEIHTTGTKPFVSWRNESIPVRSLGELLQLKDSPVCTQSGQMRFLVLEGWGRHAGVLVDNVISEAEVVVRPLGKPLSGVAGLAGFTITGSGEPMLIINPLALMGTWMLT
jgi:two-component system chemotaxis sensor kinase CheA